MITLDLTRYKKFIYGYVHMYLHTKDSFGNLVNPEGGQLSHILKYGIIAHNNICLTYFQCKDNHDNLGAFLCLIMLCFTEKQLSELYFRDWEESQGKFLYRSKETYLVNDKQQS